MTHVANCGLCAKPAKTVIEKWFVYDNGSQFRIGVCTECANLHTSLIEKDKK